MADKKVRLISFWKALAVGIAALVGIMVIGYFAHADEPSDTVNDMAW